MAPGVAPVIVDANALVAIHKTSLAGTVHRTVRMCTTNVCNEEVKRGTDARDASRIHSEACRGYLDLLTETGNPETIWMEEYVPYVEDQGEDSILDALDAHHDRIAVVVTFDFDAVERFDAACVKNGYAIDVRYPNFLFEKLREREVISTDEYCEATYSMAQAEGWLTEELLAELASTSGVDCPQF